MSIFPLPLVPFEHYMLADDYVDYPMTFFLRLQFCGRFDRDRAAKALEIALLWHPLLSARVEGDIHGPTSHLSWIDSQHCRPPVVWQTIDAPLEFASGPHIDLTREPGLRLWIRESADVTELLVQMHHACCDGLGAIQFMETFLEFYESGEQPPEVSQPPPDWESRNVVRRQVLCGNSGCTWRQHWGWLGQAVKRIGRYYKCRPAPLATPQNAADDRPPAEPPIPALESHFFDGAGSARIRAFAKQRRVSANALLTSELFLALDEWNHRHAIAGNRRALRIVVPVNLRDVPRERLPAFNAVSLAFIDRQPDEMQHAGPFLAGIDRELGEAKSLRGNMVLLPVLRMLGRFHNGICGRLKACPCLGSAVFSNLGLLFSGSRLLGPDRLVHCDHLVLTKFEAAPPVRRNTLASFAASMYGNALTISLCYDWHCLTPAEGRALLDLYVRRLQAIADGCEWLT